MRGFLYTRKHPLWSDATRCNSLHTHSATRSCAAKRLKASTLGGIRQRITTNGFVEIAPSLATNATWNRAIVRDFVCKGLVSEGFCGKLELEPFQIGLFRMKNFVLKLGMSEYYLWLYLSSLDKLTRNHKSSNTFLTELWASAIYRIPETHQFKASTLIKVP